MDEGQKSERKREVCFLADRRVMHELKGEEDTSRVELKTARKCNSFRESILV